MDVWVEARCFGSKLKFPTGRFANVRGAPNVTAECLPDSPLPDEMPEQRDANMSCIGTFVSRLICSSTTCWRNKK